MGKSRKKFIITHGPVQISLPISSKKEKYDKQARNLFIIANLSKKEKLIDQKVTNAPRLEAFLLKNSRPKRRKKQKVAMLAWDCLPEADNKGKSTHIAKLAASLAKGGHEIHVFTRGKKGETANQKIDRVYYHRIHIDSDVSPSKGVSIFAHRIYERIKRIESRERPFNVIHCYDWHPAQAIESLQNGTSRRLIFTPHMNGYRKELPHGDEQIIQQDLLAQELIKASDRIICFDQEIGTDIRQRLSVPDGKLHIISKAFNWQDYQWVKDPDEVKKRYDVCPLDLLILFVGELNHDYGPDILVDAIPALLKNTPQVRFLFVGCGELEWLIRVKAHYLLLEHAIRLVGHKEGRDLQSLFQAADIIVIPSRIQNSPYLVLAAWSAKKPVVVTHAGSFGLIKHLENGILVYDHPNSIVWGTERIIFDRDKGHEIAQKGWEEIQKNYSWNAIAQKIEHIYQSRKYKSHA